MRLKILVLFVGVLCFTANSQSFNYQPLTAQGEIPEDFSANYTEKVALETQKLGGLSHKDRKVEVAYHAYNEFIIDAYLTSGKVIYGDKLTEYLNEVLDKVLAKDKDLRDEMRVYAVRNADFNAYTTSKGIIFVNMGLLAELATEAQLAYVLAHEVAHYAEKHVRLNYDYKETVSRSRSNYGYNIDEMAKSYYDYSKEHELEADKEGFESYFEHTGYSTLAPFELMDIMLYSYLPFDEIDFDFSVFKTESYGVFNAELLDFEAKEISARDDVSDKLSTHPNIKARTAAIENFLELKKEGKDFIVSEERFKALREQARFESLDDFLITARYDRAIYQAFLLLQTYPDDDYLKRAIVYAVYGTSVYKNYDKLPPYVKNLKDVEGQLSRVRNALKNIDQESLNTLAVAMSYEFYRDHPEDKLAERIYEDAVWELTHYYERKLAFYHATPERIVADSTVVVEEIELQTTGKVKRLKKKQDNSTLAELKYAFSSYLGDTAFTTFFNEMEDDAEEYKETRLPRLANRMDKVGKQQTLKDMRENDKAPYGSYYIYPERKENVGGKGVRSVLAVTPESYTLQQSGRAINFKKSEEGEKAYIDGLKSSAKTLHVGLELFDYKHESEADADRFNELQTLQMWYDEHTNHDNIGIVNYMYYRVSPICDKYETDYLLYTGVLNLTSSGMGNSKNVMVVYGKFLATVAVLPAMPFVIAEGFLPTYQSLQFVYVLNLRTDKVVLSRSNEITQFRTNAIQNNLLYSQMNELSSKPIYKKKK